MSPSDRVWREHGLHTAVLAGDERAWRTWYDESFDGIYAYVLWRCGGLRDLADEIVQETWLRAVRRVRAFDPGRGSFVSWLCGIAANVLRNHFRKHERRAERSLETVACPTAAAADAPLEAREEAERIARALTRLPPRYEAVLRAKYLDQQSVAEIAAAANETPKAVESLLTRARQAFREVYQQLE
ncbi:MAG TPA: RNA polymerase sigma factor [Gemmataceae bacterium]|nr:RNA polymerase sigma factor [Gemmataceae bacterium]